MAVASPRAAKHSDVAGASSCAARRVAAGVLLENLPSEGQVYGNIIDELYAQRLPYGSYR